MPVDRRHSPSLGPYGSRAWPHFPMRGAASICRSIEWRLRQRREAIVGRRGRLSYAVLAALVETTGAVRMSVHSIRGEHLHAAQRDSAGQSLHRRGAVSVRDRAKLVVCALLSLHFLNATRAFQCGAAYDGQAGIWALSPRARPIEQALRLAAWSQSHLPRGEGRMLGPASRLSRRTRSTSGA